MGPASISAYLLCVLVGLAVWKLVHWLWTERHLREFMSKYPGPRGVISMWALRGLTHKFNFLSLAIEFHRYYKSKNACLWFAKYPFLVTSDPVIISQICSSPALQNKSIVYSDINYDIGGGLIFISGDKWRHHRKGFNPAFKKSTIMCMIGKFIATKDMAISELNKMADGVNHNLEYFCLYLSAKTAFDTIFKTSLSKAEVYDYINIATPGSRQLEWRMFLRILNVPLFNHMNKNFECDVLEAKRVLRKIMNEQMESSTRETAIVSDDGEQKTPKVLMDQSIELVKANEISFEDIVVEHMVLLSAAYETTGFTIFTVLVMLAMHPGVQDRVFEEIVDIFPDKDFTVNYEHIQELKYLDMVINETMRLIPAVPYIFRDVTENTPLNEGVTLPKGLQIVIFIYSLHRDESLWGPDAGRFNPDHFLPDNVQNRSPHAFMPFSKGARNCIGMRYAEMMMNIVLSGLIRNFKFSTDYKFEDLKFKNSASMFYAEVPLLKIERRA